METRAVQALQKRQEILRLRMDIRLLRQIRGRLEQPFDQGSEILSRALLGLSRQREDQLARLLNPSA